jgi:hypothetical protein
VSAATAKHDSYSFGDSSRPGVLLGFPARQVIPVAVGVVVATFGLMTGLWPMVVGGPAVGALVAFGRWRGAPLYEFAVPGLKLAAHRGRSTWAPVSLLAAGPGFEQELPGELHGVALVETTWPWTSGPVAVVHDRSFDRVSATITVSADGFPMRSLSEQDAMLAVWGAAVAPFARPHSPVVRITWHEWSHPKGVASHRQLVAASLARRNGDHPDPRALADYDVLLDQQAPVTVAHEVTITVSVDLRRVRRRRGMAPFDAAVGALGEELELFVQRLDGAGMSPSPPLTPTDVSCLIRMRSDPSRARPRQLKALRQSLATSTGRAGLEWGPMAVETGWASCTVDGSVHRTYRMTSLPLLPMPANWLDPLLTDTATTRTVTLVWEPIPLNKAAAAANRELTSIEASNEEKVKRGFRVTARERRRLDDVEARERELARGHPEFRHAGLVTVTADTLSALDDACAQVENAAGKSLIDLRPLVARQGLGWVASLPLGRSFRPGRR